ncbi:phytase [Spartinivicinus poritis]|uniref:Phytase n=1 Tax=Spartinivicinus poritis TaxID=2994640 RepID=A0ABT5U8L3_9GAMM|nr:phytase [Spartinivicinus sp. A2-2]MDE1461788.1 phytase [Spartinivicinus sp. A2-2]
MKEKNLTATTTLFVTVFLFNPALANKIDFTKITASQETRTFFDDKWDNESDADDPTVWVNPHDSAKSLIIGTLKQGGLAVFNLQGKMIQQIIPEQNQVTGLQGRYNNVDILTGYLLEDSQMDLAVVTDRGTDKLKIFSINYQGESKPVLTDITSNSAPMLFSRSVDDVKAKKTAYGLAVHYNQKQQQGIGFVTQANHTKIAQINFYTTPAGKISYTVSAYHLLPSNFNTESDPHWSPCQEEDGDQPQLEGLVIDSQRQLLYASQEQVGIWQIPYQTHSLTTKPSLPVLIDTVASFGVPYKRIWDPIEEEYQCHWLNSLPQDAHLKADVEGLALYQPQQGQQYLIASSQGDDHYAVYQLNHQPINPKFIGRFQINKGLVDGTSHTDGIAITTQAIGDQYPHGLMVVQDGDDEPISFNSKGKQRDKTNFKFVSWEKIKRYLGL